MALGTATASAPVGHNKSNIFIEHLSFLGDDSYAAGGTAAFQAYVRAAMGKGNVEVLGVLPQECAGYVPVYDKANDKLKVYESAADGSPMDEVSGDQSAVTYTLLVLCR